MKINAIIVEDELEASKLLQLQLQEHCPNIQIIDTANSVEDAIKKVAQHDFDLLFLDVELGDGNGFELLAKIETIDFKVVFITAYSDYAIDAFKAEAIDYLLKPIDPAELVAAVGRVEKRLSSNTNLQLDQLSKVMNQTADSNVVSLHENGRISFIKAEDIVYLKADGQYTMFKLENGDSKTASINLGYFEKMVALKDFFRIHRSVLINLHFVSGLDTTNHVVQLKNNESLPYSQAQKETFIKLMESLKT